MATPTHNPQLRKVAVLVDSLDASAGAALLASLPAAVQQAVHGLADGLGEVPEAEREAVLREFHGSAVPAPRAERGVELELSASGSGAEDSAPTPKTDPSIALEEALAIAPHLTEEHPQTVAIVLSRLEPETAAQVLGKLPAALQSEAVARLSEPEATDPEAVAVIERQLAGWLGEHRQRKARAAAGTQLVQRLLQGAAPDQHQAILGRLKRTNPAIAARLSPAKPVAITQADNNRPTLSKTTTTSPEPPAKPAAAPIVNPLTVLESAQDAVLRDALSHCDPETVLRALAGAGERLLARVLKGQKRSVAKQFRRRLANLGPTRLSDIERAQAEVAGVILAGRPGVLSDPHTPKQAAG
ncbi:MAG: FliG C-terminal domain-containing protein [Planctomycetota bacterium]